VFGNKVDVYVGIITSKGLRIVGQSHLLTWTKRLIVMHSFIQNHLPFDSIHTLIRGYLFSENAEPLECVVFVHPLVNAINPWTLRIP
jgi:hypothetical protein